MAGVKGLEPFFKSKNKLYIDDGSAEIEVYIKSSTGIVLPDIKEGDILELTGILNRSKNNLQLLLRFDDDIKIVKVAGWETENFAVVEDDKQQRFIQTTNFLYITFIGLIIALSGLIYKLKNHMEGKDQSKITDFQNFWKIITLVCVAVIAEGIILWAATADMAVDWTYDNVVAPRVAAQDAGDVLNTVE